MAPDMPLPLFCFSDSQKMLLHKVFGEAVNQLMQVQFNEPDKDSLAIRQHAFLSGKIDALNELLRYDQLAMAEAEEQAKALTPESQQAVNPAF